MGFDLSEASRTAAAEAGVAIEPSADAAVRDGDADVVITMLPAGKHVRAVWAELLPVAKEGALFIDCSTIDVDSARAVHEMARKAGVASLDAPVSGGTGGAKGATLTFMAGGADDAFARGKPILEKMGARSSIAAAPAPARPPRSATT